MKKLFWIFLLTGFLFADSAYSQKSKRGEPQFSTISYDEVLYKDLKWRNIGPFRGGRSTTVTGVTSNPLLYYFGATGGGVWKTTNAGKTWENISDGYFNTGSVGAIAVSESDPNVVFVGMGESPIRGVMTSSGDGVYKSVDGGDTWNELNKCSSV